MKKLLSVLLLVAVAALAVAADPDPVAEDLSPEQLEARANSFLQWAGAIALGLGVLAMHFRGVAIVKKYVEPHNR